MRYWLFKTEADCYSIDHLAKAPKQTTFWDGVRNYQARNNLQAMRTHDLVLFYHSNEGMEVVGIAKVVREAYPDPTTEDKRWMAVDLAPLQKLGRGVSLQRIKDDARLGNIGLIRQGRLSVMPLKKEEFDAIVELGS